MPAKIASSIAGRPSLVPGILMKRLGSAALARCRSLAAARVLAVSCASSGDTSRDTHPSTPFVRSWIGRNRSAARVRSSSASSKKSALARLALLQLLADRGVVGRAVLDRVVEDRRIRGQPGHREFVDVAFERAAVQQVARDVVEPDALAQIVELLRCFHCITFVVGGIRWRPCAAKFAACRRPAGNAGRLALPARRSGSRSHATYLSGRP